MSEERHKLDEEEVSRRVPALRLIDDPEIRAETARLTAMAPDYFWEVPASTSGYHHPCCTGRRGLWAHTLMLPTVINRLADSYVQQDDVGLKKQDVDCAYAAAILHDQRKNGDPENPSDSSVSDHDLLMAGLVEQEGRYPDWITESITGAISSHMGPWYDGPEPVFAIDRLVHHADMVASTASITPAIQGPLPKELDDLGLEVVYLDD